MALSNKNLLGISELSKNDISLILDTADSFKEISGRAIKKVPTLRGRTIVNLFLEPSTRTRISFEIAAKRLSADVINVSEKASSVVKGECLKDTAKTLEALNADMVIIRHRAAGAAHLLSRSINSRIINAGDGVHEHPTQSLLDLYTIKSKLGKIKGLKIAIVGDICHSRVARSNIQAFQKMGADVILIGPPTLIPLEIERLGVSVYYNLDEVINNIDVIYLLRIQAERIEDNRFPSIREYISRFGINKEKLNKTKDNMIIMHPGPMNRGIEITSDVADLPLSLVTDQVANGIAVRMAVIFQMLGGGKVG